MKMNLNQGIVYFNDSQDFKVGFTTKTGGINSAWGFNLGLNTEEPSFEIQKNRELYRQLLGNEYEYAFANQVHSSNILLVNRGGIYDGVDGFVTKEKKLVINILTADCLGIAAVDVENGVIGAFHAGWKGSAEKIVQKGVEKMLSLGAKTGNIQVFIAPGIKAPDYEVGEDLKNYFPEKVFEIHDGKICLNLESENIRQLNEMGINKVTSAPFSTFQEENLFSFRRDAKNAGRFATFIVMG